MKKNKMNNLRTLGIGTIVVPIALTGTIMPMTTLTSCSESNQKGFELRFTSTPILQKYATAQFSISGVDQTNDDTDKTNVCC